jgi:peptidoglycan/xylan/chitin deacetylase (PgdA/CDA1 family)
MYHDVIRHDVDESGFPGPGPARYKLRWDVFLAHLDALERRTGKPPATVDYILAEHPTAESWLLTFDDGGVSALAAGGELVSRGWNAHFFICTDLIGRPGFLNAEEIRELREMGHVIGSHSSSHPHRISSLPEAKLVDEWRTSVAKLAKLLGEEVRIASVPGGFYASRVASAARSAGISALFTSEPVRTARWSHECLVIGRLPVRETTSPISAARAAAGDRRIWFAEYLAWNLRKPLKAIDAAGYEALRSRVLARRLKRQSGMDQSRRGTDHPHT